YTFNAGDVITVKGTIDQFNGLTQIEPEEIAVESVGGDLLDPELVTTLNESTESSYIKMDNMSFVDPSQWAGDGSSFNVDIMDGDGNMFIMRIDNDSELSTMSAPDAPFNVVGIGGQFDRNEPLDEGYQIFPFFAADFTGSSSLDNIIDENAVMIYPNPFRDQLIIESEDPIISTELFNIQGQRLLRSSESTTLDVSEIANGVYFIRIETKDGGLMKKVIKE
ncbi:MAG: T9SS type A sorting domain-containing protein, partial [Saprospiraceae bacterium]|nr:T9SS type A sorting domain-containing protein [Saprospiraceae bacterium]